MINSQDKVEIAIRAAMAAKDLLGLLECSNIQLARMQFDIVKAQMRELDDRLKLIKE